MSDDTALEPGIVTTAAAALADFYVEALLFEPYTVMDYPQGQVRRLTRGNARLKLFQPADPIGPGNPTAEWSQHRGWSYAALLVGDAASESERVRSHGGEVLREVSSHRPGAWAALVADPEGNVWELLQESRDP